MKPAAFEDFWKAYPRRVGKLAAKRKYQQALKHATHDEIMAGVAAFVEAAPWDGNLHFCPHPATWLHNGRWDDEHEAPTVELEWHERMTNTKRIREEVRRSRGYDA